MNYAILLSKPARGSNVRCVRCLRKVRFSYIDTSPALSARRHLRAALRYSACPPHRPSCLDLGCQTHQTWCAPRHLGAAPCQLVACALSAPNSKLFAWTTVAIVGAWHAPGRRLEPYVRAVRCGRAGCDGEGRLCCDRSEEQLQAFQSASLQAPLRRGS